MRMNCNHVELEKTRIGRAMRSVVLFLVVLAVMVAADCAMRQETVLADDETWQDGVVTAVLDEDGVLTISGTGAMTDYTDDYTESPWYYYRYQIDEIVIEEGITHIGDYSFVNTYAERLTLPSTLTSIGEGAFYACSWLESITIPNNVTEIGDRAFVNCSRATSITLGSSLTTIGDYAFQGMAITTLTIPDSVTSIGYEIARDCTSLVQATVGSGVETLEYLTFSDCTSLTKVTLKSGLKTMKMQVFYNCTSLTDITLPDTLETISWYAFYNCSSLTSLTIPDSVTTIEEGAFEGCANLKITLPAGFQQMEDGSYVKADKISITGTLDYTKAYEVLDLVNEERAAEGLSALKMDEDLLEAAMQRAAEICVYYSHTRPCGLDCFTACDKIYGENIAVGQMSASAVMNAWMNSSGHRANILKSSYTTIGVGCFALDGYLYWVQVFGRETASAVSKPANTSKSMSIVIDMTTFSKYASLKISSTDITAGKKASCEVYLVNPEWGELVLIDASSLTWSSGSTSVATVSKKGVVTGKGAGSANITVKSAAGAISLSTTVKVTCAAPTISSIANKSSGVKISWGAVTGAVKYQVWRKSSSGSWAKLGTTTTTSYTDKTAKAGKTYSYRVRCVKSNGTSSASKYSSTEKIRRLTNGKISSLSNTSSGIKVKWSKVTGASGYYVYRKTGSGSFTRITTITSVSTLTYTDTSSKLKNGTTYTYCVKPYYKSGSTKYTGSYTSKKTVRLTSNKISSLKNSSSKKMKVKWSKNSKATGYQIQYSTSSSFKSGNKKVTVTGKATVSKTIGSLTKGKTYYVRVRSYKKVSGTNYYSAWSSKKSVKVIN